MARAARADAAASSPLLFAGTGAVFALVALLVGADVMADTRAGSGPAHVGAELAVIAIALACAALFWWRFVALRREAGVLAGRLGLLQVEAERWRQEAEQSLRGLGAAIDQQFDRWALSAAEREVALLLLKGLAQKEIAELRRTSERTVRQQSLAVYRKAGLSGRAELAAFFLEDLLLPETRGGATRA